MGVVPVRLTEGQIRKLNMLTNRGVYRSRNEAIRALIEEGLQTKLGEDDEVTRLVDRLLNLSSNGEMRIRFKSRKTAPEIVAEGRQ